MKTQFLAILSFGAFAAFGQGRVAYEPWVDGKVQSVQSIANNAAAQVRALNGVVTGDDFALVITNYNSVTRMPSLSARYKLGDMEQYAELSDYDLFLTIGKKRGFLVSGGEINTERTSLTLLEEFRAAKIGRITLDRYSKEELHA